MNVKILPSHMQQSNFLNKSYLSPQDAENLLMFFEIGPSQGTVLIEFGKKLINKSLVVFSASSPPSSGLFAKGYFSKSF